MDQVADKSEDLMSRRKIYPEKHEQTRGKAHAKYLCDPLTWTKHFFKAYRLSHQTHKFVTFSFPCPQRFVPTCWGFCFVRAYCDMLLLTSKSTEKVPTLSCVAHNAHPCSQIGSMKTSPVPSPSVCLANASHHTRRPRFVQCCLVHSLSLLQLHCYSFSSVLLPYRSTHTRTRTYTFFALCAPAMGIQGHRTTTSLPLNLLGDVCSLCLKTVALWHMSLSVFVGATSAAQTSGLASTVYRALCSQCA